jgi:hypothetical protein
MEAGKMGGGTYQKMSPRMRAITKVGGIVIAGVLLVQGCGLFQGGLLPQSFLEKAVERSPAAYITAVSDYIVSNPEGAGGFQPQLSGLVRAIDNGNSLSEQDRMELFSSNASRVPASYGIRVCDSEVIDKAESQAKLDYLTGEISELPAGSLYQSLIQLFSK